MPQEILCPSCQQTLRVREGYAGATLACPRCSATVPVPAAGWDAVQAAEAVNPQLSLEENLQEVRPAPRARPAHRVARCPFCDNEISPSARKCPHCREWLDEDWEDEPPPNPFKPCPSCGTKESRRVTWTFWGSFYGPAMFTHVRCPRCGYAYNGKTGRSNLLPAVFFVIAPILGIFCLIGGLFAWLAFVASGGF